VFVILWMGVYPQTFLRKLDTSVTAVIQHVERGPEYFGVGLEAKR
jgi:NADH:ubiquinone oxidoreductase subunit 4 (subunit M)